MRANVGRAVGRVVQLVVGKFGHLGEGGVGDRDRGRAALDRIEDHAVPLAAEMRLGLAEQGFDVITPPGNRSAVVAFRHGVDPDLARQVFERRRVLVSFRGGGSQVRAGVALGIYLEDVERLLEAAEELRSLK